MPRIRVFDIEIDAVGMQAAIDVILGWLRGDSTECRFVVTPNVNHVVLLQSHTALQRVYRAADLILADGFPLILASRLLKRPLPERVAGSELVPKLFESAAESDKRTVFLLGAAEGVGERAAAVIRSTYPGVEVTGVYSPPLGFESDAEQNQDIIDRINDKQPDILIIGLGAPKQELWIFEHRNQIQAKIALCVGATIDFIAGEKSQAPIWMPADGAGMDTPHPFGAAPTIRPLSS